MTGTGVHPGRGGPALAVAAAALCAFVLIALDVRAGGLLTVVDGHVAAWLHHRAGPPLAAVMRAFTWMGSGPAIGGLGVLAAAALVVRRRWRRLAALLVVLPGGVLLNEALKLAFHRPRPHFAHPLVVETSYSFPSGHTVAATLLYGLAAVCLVRAVRTPRRRVPGVLAAVLLIVLVAFSRLYLGAHYLSDVLGAMAEGVAWLASWLAGLAALERRRPGTGG